MHTFLIALAVYAALTIVFLAHGRWKAYRQSISEPCADAEQATGIFTFEQASKPLVEWMGSIGGAVQDKFKSNTNADLHKHSDSLESSTQGSSVREVLYEVLVADPLQMAGMEMPRKAIFSAFMFDVIGGGLLYFFFPVFGLSLCLLGLVVCALAWKR